MCICIIMFMWDFFFGRVIIGRMGGGGGIGFEYLVFMFLGHPPLKNPLDAHYYSVVDELQLS